MLVLSRKEGEKIHIGGGIIVTVTHIKGGRVKLGIEAPASVGVVRGELQQSVADFRGAVSAPPVAGPVAPVSGPVAWTSELPVSHR